MRGPVVVEFLLLSEDTSKHWPRIQEQIVRRLLVALDPDAALEHGIRFDPPPSGPVRRAFAGSNRKEGKRHGPPEENFRLLLRTIADHIAYSNRFCTFHFDGDRPWSERETSENVRMFGERVV